MSCLIKITYKMWHADYMNDFSDRIWSFTGQSDNQVREV